MRRVWVLTWGRRREKSNDGLRITPAASLLEASSCREVDHECIGSGRRQGEPHQLAQVDDRFSVYERSGRAESQAGGVTWNVDRC